MNLEKIIRESIIPNTPDEKMENLLSYLHSLQDYEGAIIKFPEKSKDLLAKKLYFKNYCTQYIHPNDFGSSRYILIWN